MKFRRIRDTGNVMHCRAIEVFPPSNIRPKSRNTNAQLYEMLVRRFGYRCMNPGCTTVPRYLTVDHILGKWPGKYKNRISNLQLLCLPCHREKDNIGKQGKD